MIKETLNNARVAEFDIGRRLIPVTRRGFLALSALAAGTLALGGCSSTETATTETASTDESNVTSDDDASLLRCGMEVDNAPYNWQTDTETEFTIPVQGLKNAYADGYDVAVCKMIGERLGRTPIAVKMLYPQLISNCKDGNIDIVVAGMTPTEERKESIDFTEIYFEDSYGLLVKADSEYAGAHSLAEFAGATVVGQKDTMLDEVIDEIPDVNHGTPVDTVSTQINALKSGTCDAITYNQANTDGFLRANPELVAIEFDEGKGFSDIEICAIGLAYGQDELKEEINKFLAEELTAEVRARLWQEACDRQPQ